MRTRVSIGSLFVITALASCGGHQARTTPSASTGHVSRPIAACPVTLPRPWTPPPGVPQRALFGSGYTSGNGRLWVGGLWPSGVIQVEPRFTNTNGSVGMKFGWWRNVPGLLRISGRRLDGTAPPLRAHIPDGYGITGFQSSAVYFPTAGCWQVTGTAGTATLTFVTMVVKAI